MKPRRPVGDAVTRGHDSGVLGLRVGALPESITEWEPPGSPVVADNEERFSLTEFGYAYLEGKDIEVEKARQAGYRAGAIGGMFLAMLCFGLGAVSAAAYNTLWGLP